MSKWKKYHSGAGQNKEVGNQRETNNFGQQEYITGSTGTGMSVYDDTFCHYGVPAAMAPAVNNSYAQAQLSTFKSKLRAAYTKQALDNTATLNMVKDKYTQMSPSGQAEYQRIVQAYAYYAMQEIVGGEW